MSIFSKSADPSSPEFKALIDRWDGFIKKVETRYYEILQQAEGPLNDVINNIEYDTVIIHNITTALKYQTVDELGKKVEDGWKKMRGEMEKIGASYSDISYQANKGLLFKNWLRVEFQKFKIRTFANAGRKILDNVKKHIDEKKLHKCTQCGAELPIKIYSFMAVNLKCESCGSVNTYQPDDRIRALEYYVVNALAEENAMNEKISVQTDKNKAKDYYEKYYGYIMENVPDKKDFYKREMDTRIKWASEPGFHTDAFFS